jgi:hypothetical protein
MDDEIDAEVFDEDIQEKNSELLDLKLTIPDFLIIIAKTVKD